MITDIIGNITMTVTVFAYFEKGIRHILRFGGVMGHNVICRINNGSALSILCVFGIERNTAQPCKSAIIVKSVKSVLLNNSFDLTHRIGVYNRWLSDVKIVCIIKRNISCQTDYFSL